MQRPDSGKYGSWQSARGEFAGPLLDPDRLRPQNICGPEGSPADSRFDIYRNNVTHSLKTALAEIFPAVQGWCGQDRFAHVTTLYVRSNPPRSRLLFEYGHDFADFLDSFEPARVQMPWLAGLARLERAWLDAWHAADAGPLTAGDLSQISPEDLTLLVFEPHPALRLVRSDFAIYDLLVAGRGGGDRLSVDPRKPQSVLVTRPALDVELRLLPPGGLAFFDSLKSGSTLGEASGAGLDEEPDFDLASAIAALLASGAFAGACKP